MGLGRNLAFAAKMPRVAWDFSRLGFRRRQREFAEVESLTGKTCAVTGGNGGIGYAIAEEWVRRGGDVWLLCRNRQRGEDAATRLADAADGRVELAIVDVSSFESIDELPSQMPDSLDALVHNAGALVHERIDSADGIESTLATHVVGPHRLTLALLPALEASGDGRVITVSSGGMYSEKLVVDDLLEPPEPFDGVRAYALAKRAQVVLNETWASREPSVRFYSMHPGWVDTAGVRTALPRFYRTTRRWLRTPAEGADTAVWLAGTTDLEVASGSFVFDRQQVPTHLVSSTRADDAERQRLWNEVERLATEKS